MLPNFLDPGTYVRGTAQLLNDIAGPSPRRRATKPRKPKGIRKISIKTPSGRASNLELDSELATNKELLDLRFDSKKMIRDVEERLEDSEKRFDDLLERLKVKEAVAVKEKTPGSIWGGVGDVTTPSAWVPMIPIAAIVAKDFFDSPAPIAIGLGGLALMRLNSGEPLGVVDYVAFGLGGAIAYRKFQDEQEPSSSSASSRSRANK